MTVRMTGSEKKMLPDTEKYHRNQMQKDIIIQQLKERGCRITRQRLLLLDVILENECSSCKEIFYKAAKTDEGIGTATVYRMINVLEEIGAISRKNTYKVTYPNDCTLEDACTVVLDDQSVFHLSARNWGAVIRAGLSACGYLDEQDIVSATITTCG